MKTSSETPPLLDERRVGRCADRLFLYCFLAYTVSYLGRKNLGACLPAIIEEGLITKSGAGYITTAYMFLYGMGQVISGFLASRIPPQCIIAVGLMGAGLCNLGMSAGSSLLFFVFIWAFNGLFNSMLWAPIVRVFTDQMPPVKRERAGVNISASCVVGAILAYLTPAAVLRLARWRVVFLIAGGVLWLMALVWIVGNRGLRPYLRMMEDASQLERTQLPTRAASPGDAEPKKRSFIRVFLISGLCFMILPLSCNGALRDAVETWAPTFMTEAFGLEDSMAALTTVIIPLVSLLGPYVADGLYRRVLHNEVYTCLVLFGITTLCVGGIFLTHKATFGAVPTAVFMAIGVAAMFGTNHIFLTVVPYRFAPLGLSATVSGVLNSIIYLATALCSGLYGIIAEGRGWTVLIIVWLGIGLVGMLSSLIAGRLWKTRRTALDEGRI